MKPARTDESTGFHSNLLALLAVAALAVGSTVACAQTSEPHYSLWSPTEQGIAYGFAASLTRTSGSTPYADFTVAAQLTARNGAGVDQWAFGAATEAWAMSGSRSILVGLEAAVINEEPTNDRLKIASNVVFKNRADGMPAPASPMNAASIAYWITAQPGTGFERGLVFDKGSLLAQHDRPVAIDLSDLSDHQIESIDIVKIRKNVSLRYVARSRSLVLHIE
jgi:hypothetical protein